MLAILALGVPWRRWLELLKKPAFILAFLASLSLALWANVAALPNGRLQLTILGQSDTPMLLLRSPAGQYILINGESEPATLSEEIETMLPPFKRELAFVIIPSCTLNQTSGLFGLTRQVNISHVLWGCDPGDRQVSKRLWNAFAAEGISQARLTGAEQLNFQQGILTFTVESGNLQALELVQAGFSGMVLFDDQIQPAQTASLLVQPWQTELAPSSAQVWVLTGEGTRENADNAVWAGSYRWLRLETDGQQHWLSIKQP